jgi:hypothetical protein
MSLRRARKDEIAEPRDRIIRKKIETEPTETPFGPLKNFPSNGARSLGVSLANHRVYVATTAKELVCRGCIVVYAPE